MSAVSLCIFMYRDLQVNISLHHFINYKSFIAFWKSYNLPCHSCIVNYVIVIDWIGFYTTGFALCLQVINQQSQFTDRNQWSSLSENNTTQCWRFKISHLDTSSLKQNLSKSMCIFTSFQKSTGFTKTWKHHFTSNDLTCDKTWIQNCTQNDDVTTHKSRHGVSFCFRWLGTKGP